MICYFSLKAIPALQPIVHDLFVLRGSNKADAGKELETQKEVVVSMLLRLVQYHQVYIINKVHCTQHPLVKYFFPCLVGVGDVHSGTTAMSQRKRG